MDPLLPVQTVPIPKSQKPTKSFIMFSLISLCVTVGLVNQSPGLRPLKYGVIIDAGSSGTRVHVFGYLMTQSGIAVVRQHKKLEESIGLSSFADNPAEANGLMNQMVEFMKQKVPKAKWKQTEVRLMATAGMRLLDETVQERILDVAKGVLRTSGFKFHYMWASIISGFDEGLYAWVIANYASGLLGGDPMQTKGIVELGGASAQVTFVPSDPVPAEYKNMTRTIHFGSVSYDIYSHSFLNFGVDEALQRLRVNLLRDSDVEGADVDDPCTPSGYNLYTNANKNSSGLVVEGNRFTASLKAAGDYQQCREKTLSMLTQENEECSGNCYINSTFTPPIRGNFFALAGFFYTSKFFELEEEHWLSDMISAGTAFCGKQWSDVRRENRRTKPEYLSKYCFSSAYTVSMLQDIFNFNDESIEYANEAGPENNKLSLDWAMGAFILTSAKKTSDSRQKLAYSNIPIFKL